jgi:N4-(beta-N-acetylglucosaminyl)-L-asparaginase
MQERREFLKQSLAGSAGIFLPFDSLEYVSSPVKDHPIVVSTWDFGQAANTEAWKTLDSRGRAVDAVEKGVMIPEADPTNQTVGYGGLPDRDGRVTLDSCIMDDKYNCGAVMCLEHIMHPVNVARLVMDKTPHVILVGEGALQFALANGFKKKNLLTPQARKAWKEWLKKAEYKPVMNIENQPSNQDAAMPGGPGNHDTIGMIALDSAGNMGGACTTSGMAFKMKGRVGDSPVIGAGLYVDNEIGAATSTGVGEEVIRIVGSHLVVELMRQGNTPEQACKTAVERIIKRNPAKAKEVQIGFLALNNQGQYGAYALQKGFTFSVKSGSEDKVFNAKSIY